MDQRKCSEMTAYFDKQIRLCQAQTQTLQSQDRADEAIFSKIRGNVFDIFQTVFFTSLKTGGGNEKWAEFFQARLDQIPKNWQASLDNAQAHGDVEKAYIERIKLDTAEEIWEMFEQVWEGRT